MDVDSGGTEWHHSWGSFAVRAHAHVPVPVFMAVCVCVPVSVCQCLCESGTSFLGASVGALVKRKCWPGQLILILYFWQLWPILLIFYVALLAPLVG